MIYPFHSTHPLPCCSLLLLACTASSYPCFPPIPRCIPRHDEGGDHQGRQGDEGAQYLGRVGGIHVPGGRTPSAEVGGPAGRRDGGERLDPRPRANAGAAGG